METKLRKISSQKRAADTRANLMEHGARLFAKFGYDATSIRDVCSAAGANIAAVHYYFTDKQGLYAAILKESFEKDTKPYPDPVWEEASSPQAYLEDFIFTILSRMHRTRKAAWHMQLLQREIAFPSAPFQKFIGQIIQHDFDIFEETLKAINPRAGQDTIRRAVLCLTGQLGAYTIHPPGFLKMCFPDLKYTEEECRDIARSIVHFTVCGLKA